MFPASLVVWLVETKQYGAVSELIVTLNSTINAGGWPLTDVAIYRRISFEIT
jgi:hypothetical protein